MVLTETAYAKINLALHVRKRREDGYHELETLFAFVDAGDRLEAEPSLGLSLQITGPFRSNLEVVDNLVLQAARAMQNYFGIEEGAHIVWISAFRWLQGWEVAPQMLLPLRDY